MNRRLILRLWGLGAQAGGFPLDKGRASGVALSDFLFGAYFVGMAIILLGSVDGVEVLVSKTLVADHSYNCISGPVDRREAT